MPRSATTTKAPLLEALSGKRMSPPPVWLMRQAGRYLPEYRRLREKAGSFLDLCYTPKLAAEATLQPVRRFGFDAAILFSDILVVPGALGQKVEFREGEGPVLEPVRNGRDLAGLRREGAVARLGPVMETVARVRAALDKKTALIGFCGAPWTVATYMVEGRGGTNLAGVREWAGQDPQGFAGLIGLLAEVSAEYLSAQIAAGAQAVQIFDSWAGSLSEDGFRRWSIAPTRKIVSRVKASHPLVPVIGFPRGAGMRYLDYARATGVDAVGCDTDLPLKWIADVLQGEVAVQGNLDPLLLAAGGAAMETRVREIVAMLGKEPFVFNLGHGVMPQTPPENVARLVELVRESAQE